MKPSYVTVALGAALALFWSSGFVGATLSTRTAPFDTVLAWRNAIAAVLLGVVVLVRRERIAGRVLRRQAMIGTLVQGVYLGGVFAAAEAGVPAGTTALIAALQPLIVAVLAGPLLGIPTSARQRVGLLVGAAGVAVVVAGDLGGAAAWAFLLPALAVAGISAGTLLDGRRAPGCSLVASLAIQSATGAVIFAVFAGVRGDLVPPSAGSFWFAIAWLVLLSAFGGYGTFLVLVRRSGPTLASALLYLTPPTTTLWAWAMFGQVPGPLALPGAALSAIGIVLFATTRRSKDPVSAGREPALRTRPRSAAAPWSRRRLRAAGPTPP